MRVLTNCLKVGLTFFVIGMLLNFVGWHNVLNVFRHTDPFWAIGMYSVALVVRMIEAFQMKVILSKVDHSPGFDRIFLANALSSLYSLLLPGDALASIVKWANLSAATGKKSIVLNAILYNRLALFITPLLIGATTVMWENPFPGSYFSEALIGFAVAGLVGTIWLFHPSHGALIDHLILKTAKPFPPISGRIEMVLDALQNFRAFQLKDHLSIYLISFFSVIAEIMVLTFAAMAIGLNLKFLTLAWVLSLLTSSRQLPITVSNLGIREGILIAVLSPYGVDLEKAFTLGILLFTVQLMMSGVGLGYQIALTFGLAKWKINDAGESTGRRSR